MDDTFNGDNTALASSARALIELSDAKALVPHGIGGHARGLLITYASRLLAADTRIAELEAALTERDTEIARLKDALDLSALEYADLAVSAKSLEEHLHTKPLPP